ncbi:MAG: T9SS type A sorting domain-containing protein [Bacteroidales bacterium]|nr:T9SS type A sorting domain-containing protein [Bacteroidales bacterium]MCF8404514.1 T9SS type A sorting domain-containing protein [Bacteroidales bacterium]
MKIPSRLSLTLVYISFCLFAFGQLSEGGQPLSFSVEDGKKGFQEVIFQAPDWSIADSEDKVNLPHAFSKIIEVKLSPNTHGTWQYSEDGISIWRLNIKAEAALAIGLYFKDFNLPVCAKLFVYSPDRKQLIGSFTSKNNRISGLFATELILGDECILELNVPEGMESISYFTVDEISYAFRGVSSNIMGNKLDFCEVNINCSPEGDDWQDEKKGVVRIKIKINGFEYWCTGSLVNNTAYDLTPYILTADHCAYKWNNYATVEELETWIFYFNYEAPECSGSSSIPQTFSLTGAVKIANGGTQGYEGSDFYLVKLIDDIPEVSSVYFNGWSVIDESSSNGVTIHHPDGEVKKISTYGTELTTASWNNSGLPSHWKVYWIETLNNWGVTEGGSSGSPLFNQEGRVIGTLTGGLASCTNPDTPDYYGKMSYHWDSNGTQDTLQLKPWLDPMNTGVNVLGGTYLGMAKNQKFPNIFSVYPNPVNDHFYLRTDLALHSEVTLEIYNINSQKVYHTRLQDLIEEYQVNAEIDNPGIYLLRVSYSGNSFTKKLIKR